MLRRSKWSKTIKEWKKTNPPDYGDYWYCVVGGRALTDDESRLGYGALPLTLDHDIPRSRAPTLVHYIPNLKQMCHYHNVSKGSRTLKEYLATKPSKQCKF